jgi:hypothetical protein
MVMLDSARRDAHTPVLARIMLLAAILATLAANSAAGAAHGVIGIMVSAWPAVAFIGSAELLMAMVRLRSQSTSEVVAAEALPDSSPAPEAGSQAAPVAVRPLSQRSSRARRVVTPEQIFAQELAAGTVPGIRVIKGRARCGQSRASEIKSELTALIESRLSDPIETLS